MKSSRSVAKHRFLLLAVAVLWLVGCERTVFQNPPVAAQACDPELAGRWLSQGDKDDKEGELEAIIDAQCKLVTIEQKEAGPRRSEPTTLRNARVGGIRYLWLDAAWANRSFDVDRNLLDRDGDVYLFAYRVRKDRLLLSNTDPRVIGQRVLRKEIEGEVLLHDHELTVRISGEPEAIGKTLAKHRIFRFDDALEFRRAAAEKSP